MFGINNKVLFGAGAASTAAVIGKWGWNQSGRDSRVESPDQRLKYTASTVMIGTPLAGAVGLGGYAASKMYKASSGMSTRLATRFPHTMAGATSWASNAKALATGSGSGLISSVKNIGSSWKALPKSQLVRGPLAGLMIAGAATAAVGVNLMGRDNRPADAYGSPNGAGGTEYNDQPIKRRMDALGADGNMVFGLNNMRHG